MSFYAKNVNIIDPIDTKKVLYKLSTDSSNNLQLSGKNETVIQSITDLVQESFDTNVLLNTSETNINLYTYPNITASRNSSNGDLYVSAIYVEAQSSFSLGTPPTIIPYQANVGTYQDKHFIFKFNKDNTLQWYIQNPITNLDGSIADHAQESQIIPDQDGGALFVFLIEPNIFSSDVNINSVSNSYSIELPSYNKYLSILVHYDKDGEYKYAFAIESSGGNYRGCSIIGHSFQTNGDLLLALFNCKIINHPVSGNSNQITFESSANHTFGIISLNPNGIATRKCNILGLSSDFLATSYGLTEAHDGGYILTFFTLNYSSGDIIFNDSLGQQFYSISVPNIPNFFNVQIVCKFNSNFDQIEWWTMIRNNGDSGWGWANVFRDYNGYVVQNISTTIQSIKTIVFYSDGTSEDIPNDVGYNSWIFLGHALLCKLSKQGKLVWRKNIPIYEQYRFYYTYPFVFMKNDLLFVMSVNTFAQSSPEKITVVDTSDGSTKYTFPLNGSFASKSLIPIENDFAFLEVNTAGSGQYTTVSIPGQITNAITMSTNIAFMQEVKLDISRTISLNYNHKIIVPNIEVAGTYNGGTFLGSVHPSAIQSNSIFTHNINDNAITTTKIASNQISFDKLNLNEFAQVTIVNPRSNVPITSSSINTLIDMSSSSFSNLHISAMTYGTKQVFATSVSYLNSPSTKVYGFSNENLNISSSNLLIVQNLVNDAVAFNTQIVQQPYKTGVSNNNINPVYLHLMKDTLTETDNLALIYSLPQVTSSNPITFSGASNEKIISYPSYINLSDGGVIVPIYSTSDANIEGIYGFFGSKVKPIATASFGNLVLVTGIEHNNPTHDQLSMSDTFGQHNSNITLSNGYTQSYLIGTNYTYINGLNSNIERYYNQNRLVQYRTESADVISLSNLYLRNDTIFCLETPTTIMNSNLPLNICAPFLFSKTGSSNDFTINIVNDDGLQDSITQSYTGVGNNVAFMVLSQFDLQLGTYLSQSIVSNNDNIWNSTLATAYDESTFNYDAVLDQDTKNTLVYLTSKANVLVNYSNLSTTLSNTTPGYANSFLINFDSNGQYLWSRNLGKETRIVRQNKPLTIVPNKCILVISTNISFLDLDTGEYLCSQITNPYTDTYITPISTNSNTYISVHSSNAGYNCALPFYTDFQKPSGLRISTITDSKPQTTSLLSQAGLICNEDISTSKAIIANSVVSHKLTVNADSTFNGSIYNLSDLRVKQNLSIIQDALGKINRLHGYTYERKDYGDKMAGVIAQEVNEVLPEAIRQNGDYMTVSYDAILSLLIEAVKELNQKVDSRP